ncbi:MAG: hypothetical protein JNK12_18995 [Acidimicrobiales bacterium]|nr:hypothetical protein [Acidimicrobiales bacterium]
MMDLDAGTVLLQWATGGLFFLWVTTRHRLLGIGYGWLMRGTYALMAIGAVWVGQRTDPYLPRDLAAAGVALAASVAFFVSYVRRKAGVARQRELVESRTARVADMTGIDRTERLAERDGPEFPPALDLIAPIIGFVGLVFAGAHIGDPAWLSVARTVTGALFLGVVTDAMLLGHWYLVQPGLPREPIRELVKWTAALWPVELLFLLWPVGMISALNGTIDDGWDGLLSWFWLACTVTTIGLIGVTWAALKEKEYSAVMAATGLLYLAILMAFGMDLVARAILA